MYNPPRMNIAKPEEWGGGKIRSENVNMEGKKSALSKSLGYCSLYSDSDSSVSTTAFSVWFNISD